MSLYQGTTLELAEKLFWRKRMGAEDSLWHSAANRNGISPLPGCSNRTRLCGTARQTAMLLTRRLRRTVGAPAFRPGESFLRIGLSALACRPPENRREKQR